MIRLLAWLFLVVVSRAASATVFLPIDTTVLQKATLSSLHQNRILVNGGRVLKVIYPDDGTVAVSIEEESGQAFIHTLVPNPQPITISVVTNMAVVQDIEVDFSNCSAEVIVLSLPLEDASCCQEGSQPPAGCRTPESAHPEAIQYKVNSLLNGKVPPGYTSCIKKVPARMIKRHIRGENIAKVTSQTEDLYIWRIENRSGYQAHNIWECELGFEGSAWIYLEKNCLNPCEVITAIVAVEK